MLQLLILDDQPYTVDDFARVAERKRFSVQRQEHITPFKEAAEAAARTGGPFAALVDANLSNITEGDSDELGVSLSDLGNGETAGITVLRRVFANGHDEPARTNLNHAAVAIISAETLAPSARQELMEIAKLRAGPTVFIPKGGNSSPSIPPEISLDIFLDQASKSHTAYDQGLSAPEAEAVFLDLREQLNLSDMEASLMLGFTDKVDFDRLLKEGTLPPSRDWTDRLGHLLEIVANLSAIYKGKTWIDWVNSPKDALAGRSPRYQIVTGQMSELIAVKAMVADMIGHGGG